jgi:hypothetical protein
MIEQLENFFNIDMARNLAAEGFGIVVTVLLIDRIVQWRQRRADQMKWSSTRRRIGESVGWEHTILRDQLAESSRNAYEITDAWCMAVLERTKAVKQEYAFAFTAELSGALEKYEMYLRHTVGGIRLAQWSNLDTLAHVDDALVAFLRAADVRPDDVEHLFRWKEPHRVEIKERLAASDLRSAGVPPPPQYWR